MTGDGLDREAVRRRAEEAALSPALLSKPPTGFVTRSAADVPALLDALEAAEAEAQRWRDMAEMLAELLEHFDRSTTTDPTIRRRQAQRRTAALRRARAALGASQWEASRG